MYVTSTELSRESGHPPIQEKRELNSILGSLTSGASCLLAAPIVWLLNERLCELCVSL